MHAGHGGVRGRCAALSTSSTTHNSMRSGFVYKQRSKMVTSSAEEVIDEEEKEELIFCLVSLGEEGRHERLWESKR